jgi:hypothetical protein
MIPDARELKSQSQFQELPTVDQLGTISLEQLHEYHCQNPKRRVLSIFGVLYDVTSAVDKYGPKGSYKEFAGHDVTLNLGASKMETQWMDRFIHMEQDWIELAKNWQDFYDEHYPKCGKLDKWDEDWINWPKMNPEEEMEFKQSCLIM